MSTTLTKGGTVVTMPADLLWEEEFVWRSVAAQRRYTVAGALVSDFSTRTLGRPIALRGGANFAWVDRSVVEALSALADQTPADMTLVYRGVSYTVQFDYGRDPVRADPVVDYADPGSTDPYALTLNLLITG